MIVRRDIPLADQIVQASHAALEAGFRFERPDETSHIVLLSADDEQSLMLERDRLEAVGINCVLFHEPDEPINGWTALATRPITDTGERRLLRKQALWRP